MKYETPELSALTPAIDAIQSPLPTKVGGPTVDSGVWEDISAYQDWES